jgi:hypothetical protein
MSEPEQQESAYDETLAEFRWWRCEHDDPNPPKGCPECNKAMPAKDREWRRAASPWLRSAEDIQASILSDLRMDVAFQDRKGAERAQAEMGKYLMLAASAYGLEAQLALEAEAANVLSGKWRDAVDSANTMPISWELEQKRELVQKLRQRVMELSSVLTRVDAISCGMNGADTTLYEQERMPEDVWQRAAQVREHTSRFLRQQADMLDSNTDARPRCSPADALRAAAFAIEENKHLDDVRADCLRRGRMR